MRIFPVLAGLVLAAGAAVAQDASAATYRLNFSIHEVAGGKRVNTRNYVILTDAGRKGVIRAGTKIPVEVSTGQYNYFDVGVNVDCWLRAAGPDVGIRANVDISALPEAESKVATRPAIRQIRSEVESVIPIGKPTVIVSVDDPAGGRRYDVEVTATLVK